MNLFAILCILIFNCSIEAQRTRPTVLTKATPCTIVQSPGFGFGYYPGDKRPVTKVAAYRLCTGPVKLTFLRFDVGQTQSQDLSVCYDNVTRFGDYVRIWQGKDKEAPTYEVVQCGRYPVGVQRLPDAQPDSPIMVQFISDIIYARNIGFQLLICATECPEPRITVGQRRDLRLTRVEPCIRVESPGFPMNYTRKKTNVVSDIFFPTKKVCENVTIEFEEQFAVVGSGNCNATEDDRVVIAALDTKGNLDGVLGKYCGNNGSIPVIDPVSRAGGIRVRFRTGNNQVAEGFRVNICAMNC